MNINLEVVTDTEVKINGKSYLLKKEETVEEETSAATTASTPSTTNSLFFYKLSGWETLIIPEY